MSRLTRSWSSPFGPFTFTSSRSTMISTPSGTAMGCLPMRLIRSPDPGYELAADAFAARFVTGHHAPRRGHDRGAHAALDLRHVAGGHVLPPSRLRQSLDALYHRPAV